MPSYMRNFPLKKCVLVAYSATLKLPSTYIPNMAAINEVNLILQIIMNEISLKFTWNHQLIVLW